MVVHCIVAGGSSSFDRSGIVGNLLSVRRRPRGSSSSGGHFGVFEGVKDGGKDRLVSKEGERTLPSPLAHHHICCPGQRPLVLDPGLSPIVSDCSR